MPTVWTRTLIPTLRQLPSDAEVPSHQLMLRAGYLRKLAAGIYNYLPLGVRSLHKAMTIIRQEMEATGAVEVFLPVLHPIEMWERTGRRADYGENLFVVKDRHGREQALGPTHEEVVSELVGAYVKSYRDLPLTLYQIQTKFRDEFRPRFGVLRSREFQMKDAYSFDLAIDGLEHSYQAMYRAYCRIFDRCGLPYEVVEAESGPIGGSASHEFMVPSPTGEDVILKSNKGNYAANVAKCEIGTRQSNFDGQPKGQSQEIATPDCMSIDALTRRWPEFTGSKLKAKNVLKTLIYHVEGDLTDAEKAHTGELRKTPGDKLVSDEPFHFYWIIVVRGDHQVNEAKLQTAWADIQKHIMKPQSKSTGLKLMDDAAARAAGFSVGYVGPDAFRGMNTSVKSRCHVMVDPDAAQVQFWVTGANRDGFHRVNFDWQRDFGWPGESHRLVIRDIRNAVDGDPSPKHDGGILRETKGIEVGHVFKLGTKYADAMGVSVLDENNQHRPVIMGCYGIGVNRILAAAIERQAEGNRGHDENGIIWPAALAPYQVLMTPIKYEGTVKQVTDRIAAELEQCTVTNHEAEPLAACARPQPLDVLIDDRDERPGVKFKDADLIGIPLRITVGDKGLGNGHVELKARNGVTGPKGEQVAIGDAVGRAVELLARL